MIYWNKSIQVKKLLEESEVTLSKEIKQAIFLGVFVAVVFFLMFEFFSIRGDVESALVAGISAVIGSMISFKIFK